ncbi:Small heat shock protein C4 [Grifola frondosa]|uniref:Small heat shock protein C4 n=1 Tax=Grifola frondosa TaxID=5627 RepID=A0A1C7M490_GRIFR|nr:Small heat shock protein C4 [Grifola frondosa]
MSLARTFFRELRPFFRVLEEPVPRSGYLGIPTRSVFDDPFFHSPALRPVVDVSEQGDKYIIEAELPGVKKENVDVRIGDGGRSLTIEGKVFSRSTEPQTGAAATTEAGAEGSKAVATAPEQTQISTERTFTGSSSFTRTVWLPRPVDTKNVSATLSDGVLTVTIPKAEDAGSVPITVQ